MAGFPKKTGHVKIAAFLMGLFLPAAGAATVFAAETADLDLTRSGSVGLTLTDVEGKTVSGGSVTLYEVAKLYLDDGDMAYEYTEAFSECTVTLDVTDLTMAEALVGYLAEYPADGEEKAIGGDGKISFTDLEPGLYLLVQTNESDGFERFNPFVVTVPIDMDGEWVYTVDASPKVGPVTPEETESPTEGSTEPSTEGNTEPSTERSTEPSTEGNTEPSTEGSTEPSTEENTESSTDEKTEPETSPETSPAADSNNTDNTDNTGNTNDTATSTLPQTGQLNWPVPVLAAGGILLLLVGRYLKRSEEKREKHAS